MTVGDDELSPCNLVPGDRVVAPSGLGGGRDRGTVRHIGEKDGVPCAWIEFDDPEIEAYCVDCRQLVPE